MSQAEKQISPWQNAIKQAERKFNEIALASGNNMVNFQTEAMFAMQAVQGNDLLQKCNPASIRNAVINIASVGLSLNPVKKQAYLVPRGGIAVLDISYIGLAKLATDSKGIEYICADVVREKDSFTYRGKDEKPMHEFNPFDSDDSRGEIIGAYCYVRLPSGYYLTEVLPRSEIEKIRNTSKAKNSPAWNLWYSEMCKKSVVKRARKLWPDTDSKLAEAIGVLDKHEGLSEKYKSSGIDMPRRASRVEAEEPIEGEFVEESESDMPQEDTSGFIKEAHIKVLKAKLSSLGVEENALLAAFEIGCIEELPFKSLNDALAWIEGEAQ